MGGRALRRSPLEGIPVQKRGLSLLLPLPKSTPMVHLRQMGRLLSLRGAPMVRPRRKAKRFPRTTGVPCLRCPSGSEPPKR